MVSLFRGSAAVRATLRRVDGDGPRKRPISSAGTARIQRTFIIELDMGCAQNLLIVDVLMRIA